MKSPAGALVVPPSWERAFHREPAEAAPRPEVSRARPRVRWGIHAPARSDAAGAAVLAATAALWVAFLLAVW